MLRLNKLFPFLFLFEEEGAQSGKTDNNKSEGKTEDGQDQELSFDQIMEIPEEERTLEQDQIVNDHYRQEALGDESDEEIVEDKTDAKSEDGEGKTDTDADNISVDNIKEKDSYKIDDEFIEKFDPEQREYLNALKGLNLPGKMIKIHVNSQKLVNESKKQPSNEELDTQKDQDQKIELDDDGQKAALSLRNQVLLNKIKAQFPDFPEEALTDQDELDYYTAQLNRDKPMTFKKFADLYEKESESATTYANGIVNAERNWKQGLVSEVSSDLKEFGEFLKERGISPKDIGIEHELNSPEMISDIIYRDKKVNTDIVKYRRGMTTDNPVPYVESKSVYNHLINTHIDKILDLGNKSLGTGDTNTKGSGEGESQFDFKKNNADTPPSMSNSKSKGKGIGDSKDEKDIANREVTADSDLELDEKILEAQRKKLLEE